MEQQPYLRIQQDPNFQELVAKRQRFAWSLSILMLGLYLAFIMLIAFAPAGWAPLSEGSTITRGIPVGVGLIVSSFVLTGIYVFRANGEFDELNQKILKGPNHERQVSAVAGHAGLLPPAGSRCADRRGASPTAQYLGHRDVRDLRGGHLVHHLLGLQAQPLGLRLLRRRRAHHRLPEWPGHRR